MYLKFSLALKQGYYPLKVAKDTLQEKSSLLIRHVSLVFVCVLLWTTISYSEFARSLMGYVPNEHAFAKEKIQSIPWPPSISSGYEHKRRRGICHKDSKSVRYVGALIVEQFLRLRSACHHQAKQCKKGYTGETTSLNPDST